MNKEFDDNQEAARVAGAQHCAPTAPVAPVASPQEEQAFVAPSEASPTVASQTASAAFVQPDSSQATQAAQAKPARKKVSRVWIPIIIVLALVAVIVLGVAACTSSVVGALGLGSTSSSQVSFGNTVAIIHLDGTIQYDGTECSPEGLKSLLDEAEANDSIKAVVLRVDSGGGTATAGEEMTEYVKEFSKPIVVSSASMNASAAYEISSQADYIYTAKTTEIGSIGTVLELTDYSGLLDMLGIKTDNITSADSKDSTYGTRALTEEERAYYQDMVDEINGVFIENVAEGRGVSYEQASEWATGLTWTGISAVEIGIADEIGTLEDACDKAAELGGCADDYQTSELSIDSSGIDLSGLISSNSTTISTEELTQILKELSNNGSSME